jgi:hypothetical protein
MRRITRGIVALTFALLSVGAFSSVGHAQPPYTYCGTAQLDCPDACNMQPGNNYWSWTSGCRWQDHEWCYQTEIYVFRMTDNGCWEPCDYDVDGICMPCMGC